MVDATKSASLSDDYTSMYCKKKTGVFQEFADLRLTVSNCVPDSISVKGEWSFLKQIKTCKVLCIKVAVEHAERWSDKELR